MEARQAEGFEQIAARHFQNLRSVVQKVSTVEIHARTNVHHHQTSVNKHSLRKTPCQTGVFFVDTYPIIMHFRNMSESWVQFHTGKISNVSFLKRPFTTEELRKELLKHLGSQLHFH